MNSVTKHSLFVELQRNAAACPANANRLLFEFNKQVLLEALRPLGAREVIVTYAGSGDSGQVEDVIVAPNTIDLDATRVQVAEGHHSWDPETRTHGSVLELESRDLRTALSDFCDQAVGIAGHDGYENNDGGQGTLNVNVDDGAVTLEHADFYTESDTSTHEL